MDFGKMSSDRTVWTSGKRRQKCGEQDRAVYSKETKAIGMTQKELAECLGVTNKAVTKWETGGGCRISACSRN